MPVTAELRYFKKKISLEVILACSENTRRTAKDSKMPKCGNSVALKKYSFHIVFTQTCISLSMLFHHTGCVSKKFSV